MGFRIIGEPSDTTIGSKSLTAEVQFRAAPKRSGEDRTGPTLVFASERKQVVVPMPDGTHRVADVNLTVTTAWDGEFAKLFPGCNVVPPKVRK